MTVHHGVLSVRADKPLGLVRVLSVSGATVFAADGCGTSLETPLQQGVYIVEVDGEAGKRVQKIIVR